MKCDDCKLADWDRTATGRLSPKRTGRCQWEPLLDVIPNAFYWSFLTGKEQPKPWGGNIQRGYEWPTPCAHYYKGAKVVEAPE